MPRILEYLSLLESGLETLRLEELGRTTEGRPLVAAFISSAENLGRLDLIRKDLGTLADPRIPLPKSERERILKETPTVAVVNCSIHSDETAPTQWAPRFAHRLAASKEPRVQEILDQTVVILVPCQNPDGYAKIIDWLDRVEPSERGRGRFPGLYHKYCGHDINRDWFAFRQAETRLVVDRILNPYHPQIVFDLHQMGKYGYRFFLPPYREPFEPNIDPILVAQLQELGSTMAGALIAERKAGVVWGDLFDAWSPARGYPHYRGAVRILLESAGYGLSGEVDLEPQELSYSAQTRSSNHPLPWPGGIWSHREVFSYLDTAVFAGLFHAAANRRTWLERFRSVFERAVADTGPVAGFLIPPDQKDPDALRDLVSILFRAGVELHRSRNPMRTKRNRYEAGTLIVRGDQPYFAFARCLLENTPYPSPFGGGESNRLASESSNPESSPFTSGAPPARPYDATTHCLPLMMGVRVDPVLREEGYPSEVESELVREWPGPTNRLESLENDGEGGPESGGFLSISRRSNASYRFVNGVLREGALSVYEVRKRKDGLAPGTFLVEVPREQASRRRLLRLADRSGTQLGTVVPKMDEENLRRLREVRTGIYHSYVASPDAGWTRYTLDEFGFPNQMIRDEELKRKVDPEFNCIVLPHQHPTDLLMGHPQGTLPPEYCGGLGRDGISQLLDYAQRGGTLIVLGDSCRLVLESLGQRGAPETRIRDVLQSRRGTQFSAPGALLALENDPSHPLGYGMPKRVAAFFWGGTGFGGKPATMAARFAGRQVRLGGVVEGGWILSRNGAAASVRLGTGRVILLGFRPQFRSQTSGTFKYLFNALYQAGS